MAYLDQFLKRWACELFGSQGWTRRGRNFSAVLPNDFCGVVEFSPGHGGNTGDYFTWQYGIMSPFHLRFLTAQGFTAGPPASEWSVAEMSAFRPDSLALRRDEDTANFPYFWPLTGDATQDEEAGKLLRQRLEDVALPQLDG